MPNISERMLTYYAYGSNIYDENFPRHFTQFTAEISTIITEHIERESTELSFLGRRDWVSAADSGFNGIKTLFNEFIRNI